MKLPTLLATVVVLSTTLSNSTLAQAPIAVVETSAAEQRQLAPEIWVPGTVVARYDAMISAEVEGRLNWVADIGDRVSRGDSLATIDDRMLQLQRSNNESDIKRIESELAYQARQIDRLQALSAQNNTSKAELDAAQSRQEMLSQDATAARIALRTTLLAIDKTRVAAPFGGIVAVREMSPGEFTREGQHLVRLVNTELLEVSARAPLSVSRHTQNGDSVRVKGDFSEAAHKLRALIPVGDVRSRMIEVRVDLTQTGWVIGEAVQIALRNGEISESIAVPRDALVLRNNGVSVFTVDSDGVAHKVSVVTGAGSGSFIGVRGSLESDTQVVVRGAENLRDGQQVKVIKKEVAAL